MEGNNIEKKIFSSSILRRKEEVPKPKGNDEELPDETELPPSEQTDEE